MNVFLSLCALGSVYYTLGYIRVHWKEKAKRAGLAAALALHLIAAACPLLMLRYRI